MVFEFASFAGEEFEQAARHYDAERPGLAAELADEVARTIERISDNPHAFAQLTAGARLARVHRFPYDIIYMIETDRIVGVAFMHHHRKPGYWLDRL